MLGGARFQPPGMTSFSQGPARTHTPRLLRRQPRGATVAFRGALPVAVCGNGAGQPFGWGHRPPVQAPVTSLVYHCHPVGCLPGVVSSRDHCPSATSCTHPTPVDSPHSRFLQPQARFCQSPVPSPLLVPLSHAEQKPESLHAPTRPHVTAWPLPLGLLAQPEMQHTRTPPHTHPHAHALAFALALA